MRKIQVSSRKSKLIIHCLWAGLIISLLTGCSTTSSSEPIHSPFVTSLPSIIPTVETPSEEMGVRAGIIIQQTPQPLPVTAALQTIQPAQLAKPKQWGEQVDGVKRRLDTNDKVVALTFDACGGVGSDGYDKKLIDFLIKEKIHATLFINGRWITANPDIFLELAANPLFEIENHGTEHKPLSVTGRSAYGIKGTSSVEEVKNEVLLNAQKIEKLTGRKPKFFRSGTAYYDEIAIQVVEDLGEEAVNFDVLGDAGATYTKDQIVKALKSVKPGSIVISHMNHPEKHTAEGIEAAVPMLQKEGYSFVKVEDYSLK
ncbi:MAG: polysaccharide deacetylase [Bacilli bacterium]|nr:polysaccharide deacetylase [Bacilli bacterium]